MCGIVGKVQMDRPVDRALFRQQCVTLAHRGPDDQGQWFSDDGCVALGNRRLAIQDLSPAGHMPMCDPSGQVWLTFNGEIYNFQALRVELEERGHAFSSNSDTEVVLAAYLEWETDCLTRLNGMFAFAIYDDRAETVGGRLFLARDRAGEKPLYYWRHATGFAFASELKALMADPSMPRRLNLTALNAYLAFGYVPGEMCILQGVTKLPPAHAMVYDVESGALRVWRYWSLPEPPLEHQAGDAEVLSDELANLLKDSVRQRLVADVPVGILLSGGLDSSLVTAMAAQCSSQPVQTFTVTFPGYGTYNEGPYAQQVADYFGTEHQGLVAEPASVDLLPTLAKQYDEPLADSSLVPTYLVSRLTRQHVTVALGGDGGDELFGGYSRYSLDLNKLHWFKGVPRSIRDAVAAGARRWLPVGFKGRNFLSGLEGTLGQNVTAEGSFFDVAARSQLLAEPARRALNNQFEYSELYKRELWYRNGELIGRMTRLDFLTYLPEDILAKVDRASMAASLEVRAPWLDQHIVEFAFGRVPGTLKATVNGRKILLRHLARKMLPSDLDLDRKQGFSLPLDQWFEGEWGSFVAEVLRGADSDLFDFTTLRQLIEGQRRGHANTSRLFALAMFELWRREYRVTLS